MAKHRQRKAIADVNPTQAEAVEKKDLEAGVINLHLQAIDTWFFRESRPHDAAGASELSSLFPPPIRTLAGALRAFLGDQMGIDWQTLQCKNSEFDFKKSLGTSTDLGELQLNGPWVCYQGKRLYPAPLYLMQKKLDLKISLWKLPVAMNYTNKQDIQRLQIGNMVRSDLGTVRLAEMPKDYVGYKALEQHWLTTAGMQQCLAGKMPDASEIIESKQLFSHEPRLGIARNNVQRTVEEGRLYQTQHLRLDAQVHIELEAKNLEPVLLQTLAANKQNAILRLGSEGRMASLKISSQAEALPEIASDIGATFSLHFISPADFAGHMFPQGFNQIERNKQTVWRGKIDGIEFDIESAVMGKVHREGGWNMQAHQPMPVKSYIPAGSVWFCRLTDEELKIKLDDKLLKKLHQQCIGRDSAYGRGQILVGNWSVTDKV